MRVRTRLCAVMAIPLIAATVLGGMRFQDTLAEARQYERFHETAGLTRTGTELIQQLQRESNLAVDPGARKDAGPQAVEQVRKDTSALAARFDQEAERAPQSARMRRHIEFIRAALAKLPEIRAMVDKGTAGPRADSAYLSMIMPLLGVDNELDGELNQTHSQGWALFSLTLSNSMLSSERSLMAQAVKSGELGPDQKAALLATVKIRDFTAQEFRMAAAAPELARYEQIAKEPSTVHSEAALQQLLKAPADLSKTDGLPANWYEDINSRITQVDRLSMDMSARLIAESQTRYDNALDQARTDGAITAALLLSALGLAFAVSRGISANLQRLRESATQMAEVQLPKLMHELQHNRPDEVDLSPVPTGVTTEDEIGEVAEAFDAVYREAVRLAGEQARLRESVSALFRNLSYRNQSLVQRQLSLLTALEQSENDSGQLQRLFELDHLATRMRRNSENLLVLAGGQPVSRPTRPMPLLDVLRTAMSEVEQFERVSHLALPQLCVAGRAASDVVHLVSELLENALLFSSPQSEVQVSAQQLPDQRLLIEIRDFGIGMEESRLAEANAHFINGNELAPDASEQMGLYVVGLLALRHGIEVKLRAASPGTSALVILSAELALPLARPASAPTARAFSGTPVLPAAPSASLDPDPQGEQSGGADPLASRSAPAAPSGPVPPAAPVPPATPVTATLPESARADTVPISELIPDAIVAPSGGGASQELEFGEPGAWSATAVPPAPDLPVRVPMAHLRPGSADAIASSGEPQGPPQQDIASYDSPYDLAQRVIGGPGVGTSQADRIRERLGSLHQGMARGGSEEPGSTGEMYIPNGVSR
ncbi:sensor histidine kinase [Streptomyces vinaceus]|uniref:sensor histidine kinase n=1 Tax=Streptomyces vinaceus TaxID=1960 RepID=UPI0038025510